MAIYNDFDELYAGLMANLPEAIRTHVATLFDYSTVTVVPAIIGSDITILRGDTFEVPITNLGNLSQYVSIDFTVKSRYSETDDQALIRIRKSLSGLGDGLLRLNGAAPAQPDDGMITITDITTGDITVTLSADVTDDLNPSNYVWDVQLIEAAGKVKTLTHGKLLVTSDVTRATA